MSHFRLTPPKVKLSENDVERACLDLLRAQRIYPVRLQSGRLALKDGRYLQLCEAGTPDYCIPAWFMEVKAPGGKLSQAQRLKIQMLSEYWDLETAVVEDVDELAAWISSRHKR